MAATHDTVSLAWRCGQFLPLALSPHGHDRTGVFGRTPSGSARHSKRDRLAVRANLDPEVLRGIGASAEP